MNIDRKINTTFGLFENVEECHFDAEAGFGNNQPKPAYDNAIGGEYKARHYVFTLNNWTMAQKTEIIKFLKNCALQYIVGEETAPTTGTPHLQGYMRFKNERYWSGICTDCEPFKNCWSRGAKASIIKNFNYCSKAGKYVTNIDYKNIYLIKVKVF